MVGGLIQNKSVPFGNKKLGKRNTFLLSARQFIGGGIEKLRHAEAMQSRFTLPAFANSVTHRTFGEHGELRQYANASATANAHHAGIGLKLAADDAQEGALAAAIEPHHANAVAVVQGERNIGKEGPVWSRGF